MVYKRREEKKLVSEKGYQSITEVRSGLEDKNKEEVFTMTSLFLYKNKISTNKKPYRPFEGSDITSRRPPSAKMGISMKQLRHTTQWTEQASKDMMPVRGKNGQTKVDPTFGSG